MIGGVSQSKELHKVTEKKLFPKHCQQFLGKHLRTRTYHIPQKSLLPFKLVIFPEFLTLVLRHSPPSKKIACGLPAKMAITTISSKTAPFRLYKNYTYLHFRVLQGVNIIISWQVDTCTTYNLCPINNVSQMLHVWCMEYLIRFTYTFTIHLGQT